MKIIKVLISFLFSLFVFYFALYFTSVWAGCDCLFNELESLLIFIGPLIGSAFVVFFSYRQEKNGKSYLLNYSLFFVIAFVILGAIQLTLIPVSNFLENKFPFLTPHSTFPFPVLPATYASSSSVQ